MRYSIFLNFKHLSMKVNWEIKFYIGKNEILNPLDILCIPQNFGLKKGHAGYTISTSKSLYNINKISHTFHGTIFRRFCFFDYLLNLHFLTRRLYYYHN